MNESTALFWKEWHESRFYLLIGLGMFLGLPLIAAVEFTFHNNRRFEIDASDWVLYLGGVLAVFVAVGATCRDLTGRLEDFWRSRPVSVTRWLLVKYFIGVFIVLASCEVPLVVEVLLNRDKDAAEYLVWYPFLWTALYSVGFMSGCLIRRTAHAATLALAGLLMVYAVPVIIPPLAWLSTSRLEGGYSGNGEWPAFWYNRLTFFAMGMTGLALLCAIIAVQSVRRDWHIQSGAKLMYGLISAALLLAFASAAFQLGTNLPILQQINLPADEHIEKIRFDGTQRQLLTWSGDRNSINLSNPNNRLSLRQIQIDKAGIHLGQPTTLNWFQWESLSQREYHTVKISDEASCRIDYDYPNQDEHPTVAKLVLFNPTDGSLISDVSLWEIKEYLNEPPIHVYVWNGHVYVVGTHQLVLDVSNPRHVTKILDKVIPRAEQYLDNDTSSPKSDYHWMYNEDRLRVHVAPLPDLPPERQLNEALNMIGWQVDQNILVSEFGFFGSLRTYQLTSFEKSIAQFDIRSRYKPSLLERTFSTGGIRVFRMGHLLYREGRQGGTFNSAISVFDLNPRGDMPMVGHFAAPEADYVCPLPDGRAIVGGGNKLWLVGPPPHSAQ